MSDNIRPVFDDSGDALWAKAQFRAQVWKDRRRWCWLVWDVLSVQLGGTGFRRKGWCTAKQEAVAKALLHLAAAPGEPDK